MADDLEVKQVAEANDVNMDYRKMKQTHEKVKCSLFNIT